MPGKTADHLSPARSVLGLLVWLALSLTAAGMGGLFLPGEWYAALRKPAWNPPNWIFGPVWAVLYIAMAVAAWLVWKRGGFGSQRKALSLFLTQLLFNALWSPLFFGLRSPALALANILLLWLALLGTIVAFWRARPIAGAILVPYLAWVSFATALNFAIWNLNSCSMRNLALRTLRRILPPTALALLLAMNTHAAADRIMFDFQSATSTSRWQVVNDGVMGGVSTSRFQVSNGIAVFRGRVSLEQNGGFASVRSLPERHDLSECDAFVLRVRGDGQRYKFTVRASPSFDSAIYQTAFTTVKGQWEEHRLPLKQFVPSLRGRVLSGEPALDPAKVTSVGFLISDRQEGPFQLEVAWIKASPSAGD